MRVSVLWLSLMLAQGLAGQAQDQASEPPPPSDQAPRAEQAPRQRPSLGAQPAPSLHGPRSSSTTDPRKLIRVRRIFVERMDNKLSEKLLDGLAKLGRFRVVATREEADAVLRGTCFDSRRLKSVHSEVYLNERTGGASIWQDSIRRPFNPPPLDAAVAETASLIVQHLSASVVEAERR